MRPACACLPRRLLFATCALLASVATADTSQPAAQGPAPNPDGAELDSVTVEAQKLRALEHQVSTFVSTIALPSRHESLARWQVPICAYVAGLPEDRSDYVRERVSQVASEAGVPLGSTDCDPNLVVVMTAQPEEFIRSWWDANPTLFDRRRGIGAIERTIRTPAPVRVFYNVCSAPPGTSRTFAKQPNCDVGTLGSRLSWGAVRVIYSAAVVVDLEMMEGLTFRPLSDYIAMVALAQLRKDAELGTAPTILRLFEEAQTTRPQTLSTWDQAFLKSLYGTDQANFMQISQVKKRMVQDLMR
jgi:hypothetical protein